MVEVPYRDPYPLASLRTVIDLEVKAGASLPFRELEAGELVVYP